METKDFMQEIESAIERRDIETLRNLVRHLDEAHHRYHILLGQANAAILILNPETGQILESNSRATDMFKYAAADMLRLSVRDLHPSEIRSDAWREYLLCLTAGKHFCTSIPAIRGDGSPIYVDISSARIDLGGEIVIQSIFHDVTVRVLLAQELEGRNQALEQKNRELEEAQQIRSEFMAVMSHELRSPLNAIIGYNSLLEDGIYGPLNPKQQKAVERIDRNSSRLLNLINQLLDISRMDAGVMVVFNEPVNLVTLVQQVLEDYQALADEKNIALEVTHPAQGVILATDGDKMKEIIRQLISNAIKFTSRGFVRIALRKEGEDGVIDISDTGPGIDPAKREKLFDLFRRREISYAHPGQGMGLGLVIVKRLTELLSIKIDLESEPEHGCRFRLRIPSASSSALGELEEKPEATTEVQEGNPPEDQDTKTVLIVDDDPYTVEILTEFLEVKGSYRVTKAYSGMHAMIHLAQFRPDFLLVDLLMPQINGERVIQSCQDLWGKDTVRVIVITGKSFTEREYRELRSKVHAIIRKGNLRTQDLTLALQTAMSNYCQDNWVYSSSPAHLVG